MISALTIPTRGIVLTQWGYSPAAALYSMPVRIYIPRRILAVSAAGLAVLAFACMDSAAASAQETLPDAPEPHLTTFEQAALVSAPAGFFDLRQESGATNPAQAAPVEAQTQDDPVVTMFPHSEGGRYWV